MQHGSIFLMDIIQATKRGAITIPPKYRKLLQNSNQEEGTIFTLEFKDGALILRPAKIVNYRSFTKKQIEKWVEEDQLK